MASATPPRGLRYRAGSIRGLRAGIRAGERDDAFARCGFGDMRAKSRAPRALDVRRLSHSRHGDELQRRAPRACTQRAAELDAAHARHVEVEKSDVGLEV